MLIRRFIVRRGLLRMAHNPETPQEHVDAIRRFFALPVMQRVSAMAMLQENVDELFQATATPELMQAVQAVGEDGPVLKILQWIIDNREAIIAFIEAILKIFS